MKIFLTAMTAACALGAAAPAAAQYVNANAGGSVGIENRIAQLESRLQAGIQSGAIDRSEAMNLRQRLRELRRTERLYSRNGLSQQERMDLQTRLRTLRQEMRLADGGRFDRDNRYGNWDEDDRYDRDNRYGNRDDDDRYDRYGNRVDSNARYDQYGNRVDSNARYDRYGNRIDSGVRYDRYGNRIDTTVRYDRYGNRDINGRYDRNGNLIDEGYTGRGGPYQPVEDYCQERGGIGGVIDRVTGQGCNNSSLRVGARASGNLGAVPYEYRNTYRDGNGYYYRSDGRSIYQIDARTDTIVRIYSMNR